MITKFIKYINEGVYIDQFKLLYDNAPSLLKEEVDKTKKVEQSLYWHPEGNTYIHIQLVTNRLHNCYNDINLTLSGFFHDLGKTYTTYFDDKKQSWSAPGHEDISVKILNKYSNWIKKMGGDINIIEYVIQNHMRYKHIDEMRLNIQKNLINHKYFKYLEKFSTADYGGSELECKPIKDISDIKNNIKENEIKEKENKIISDKFNGRIIMSKYPQLKGKELGNTINNFKKYIGDFRKYALFNTSDKILNDFDKFINM